jgi:large subunit ribosomal protein L13
MKSYIPNAETIQRKWYVVDGTDKVLGRLASEVAKILRGKNKPTYTPHIDTGDHVIIVNCDKVVLTGKKLDQKMYRTVTTRPGSMKETPYRKFMAERSDKAVYEAVKGMLPKNSLGRKMLTKLRVYKGAEHENAAQMPEVLELDVRVERRK